MKYAHFDNLTLERLTEALGVLRTGEFEPYPWVRLFNDYSGDIRVLSGVDDEIIFTFDNRDELAHWVDDTLEGGDATE